MLISMHTTTTTHPARPRISISIRLSALVDAWYRVSYRSVADSRTPIDLDRVRFPACAMSVLGETVAVGKGRRERACDGREIGLSALYI